MPVLAALWLALLHLLAPPAPRLAGRAAAPARGVESAALVRRAPAAPDEALRAPRPLPVLGAQHGEAPRPHAPPPHGLLLAPWSLPTVMVVAPHRRDWHPSHAPAARGGVLPYFPTAPPLQA